MELKKILTVIERSNVNDRVYPFYALKNWSAFVTPIEVQTALAFVTSASL